MTEAAVKRKLVELNGIMLASGHPGEGRGASAEGVYIPHASTREGTLEEHLDHLRLQLQYLVFDLEATRRENRYLRQMLESRPPRDSDQTGEGPPQI